MVVILPNGDVCEDEDLFDQRSYVYDAYLDKFVLEIEDDEDDEDDLIYDYEDQIIERHENLLRMIR